MPALIIGSAKWVVGADDLAIPSFCAVFTRVIWLSITFMVIWSIHVGENTCDLSPISISPLPVENAVVHSTLSIYGMGTLVEGELGGDSEMFLIEEGIAQSTVMFGKTGPMDDVQTERGLGYDEISELPSDLTSYMPRQNLLRGESPDPDTEPANTSSNTVSTFSDNPKLLNRWILTSSVTMNWILGFLISFGILNVISFLVYAMILITALQGTIMDVESRQQMPKLLTIAFSLYFFQFLITILGTFALFRVPIHEIRVPCSSHPVHYSAHDFRLEWVFLHVVVLVSWGELILHPALCWASFSSQARAHRSAEENSANSIGAFASLSTHGILFPLHAGIVQQEGPADPQLHGTALAVAHAIGAAQQEHHEATGAWEARCRGCCRLAQISTCNLFGGVGDVHNEVFREVAAVMAQFFKGLGLVPSDLIASLLLLRAEQRAVERGLVSQIREAAVGEGAAGGLPNGSMGILSDQQVAWSPEPPSVAATASSHSWLWHTKDSDLRARTRIHVQLVREARAALSFRQRQVEFPTIGSLDLDAEATAALGDAAHFGSYMVGIYGWMLHTYMRPHSFVCTLCCPACKPRALCAVGDACNSNAPRGGCCGLNDQAFRHNTGLHPNDIVYTSYTNYGGKSVPYCISIDRNKRAVVLSCRGSLSLADLITDALMAPARLEAHGRRWDFQDMLDGKSSAHSGMLRVASWMREDIDRKGVLNRLFGVPVDSGSLEQPCQLGQGDQFPDCRGFQLVLLGHSLGAGVSSVLSLLLQGWSRDHNIALKCIAFSPPGCVFDKRLADISSRWISSPFVGKDMIVRGSWHTLIKTRAQMLEVLRRAKVNKFTALRSAFNRTHAKDLLWEEDQVPNTPYTRKLQKKIEELEENGHPMASSRMFPPGRLLHLAKVESIKSRCSPCGGVQERFLPMWVDDREALDEFLISKRMLLDHFPDYTFAVIKRVADEYGVLHGNMTRRQSR